MPYTAIFKTDIFSQFQTLPRSSSSMFCTLFRQIQTYLELWLIQALNVSCIFKHIHKVTHIKAFCPHWGIFQQVVKHHFLFNSSSSLKFSNLFGTFLSFCFKGKHSKLFLQDYILIITTTMLKTKIIIITYHPRQHATHTTCASMPRTQARHSHQHKQHAISQTPFNLLNRKTFYEMIRLFWLSQPEQLFYKFKN